MQKLLSIFVYLILLIFLESAAEVTGVPASAPAELPEEPNYVAITFDDGPRRGTTTRLLDGLRERGASATFFLVGERLAGNEDLVLRMQAEGHQVAGQTGQHLIHKGRALRRAVKQHQLLPRAGHGHVKQPPVLLILLCLAGRAAAQLRLGGQNAVQYIQQNDPVIFQPLG